jgi:hypothetical protein
MLFVEGFRNLVSLCRLERGVNCKNIKIHFGKIFAGFLYVLNMNSCGFCFLHV